MIFMYTYIRICRAREFCAAGLLLILTEFIPVSGKYNFILSMAPAAPALRFDAQQENQ